MKIGKWTAGYLCLVTTAEFALLFGQAKGWWP